MNCFPFLAYNDVLTRIPQQDLVAQAREERDEVERQYTILEAELATGPTIAADPISRPSNVKGLKIGDLREMMGLAGDTNKEDWNRIRVLPHARMLDCCLTCLFLGSSTKNHGSRTDRLGSHIQSTTATKTLHALCRGELSNRWGSSGSWQMMFTTCPDRRKSTGAEGVPKWLGHGTSREGHFQWAQGLHKQEDSGADRRQVTQVTRVTHRPFDNRLG